MGINNASERHILLELPEMYADPLRGVHEEFPFLADSLIYACQAMNLYEARGKGKMKKHYLPIICDPYN